jgi:hypothetical protein
MPATSPTKAVLAAILTALASFLATVQGRTDLPGMKAIDWIIVLISAAVAGLTVYLVPNTPTGTRRRGDVGKNVIGLAIGVLLIVVLVVVLARLL